MWRVMNVVEQMSSTLSEASTILHAALQSIDVEMRNLEVRLHADAGELRTTIEAAALSDQDRASLLESLARVEKTAESVASFAHRHRDPL